jgi:hypothetical protein
MRFIIAIILLAVAILLFFSRKIRLIKKETLQTLADVAGIITSLGAIIFFVMSTDTPSQNISKHSLRNHQEDSGNIKGSMYRYLNEEQIRREIDKFLKVDNVEETFRLLPHLSSDTARDDECDHIFNYCLKNRKLKQAEEVVKFFKSRTKKEAAMKELAVEQLKR